MGRQLWCIATCTEVLLPSYKQDTQLKQMIIEYSIQALKENEIKSVKLVATRTLVRYARKIN